MEFVKSWKVGSNAFIAQRCSNRHGHYLVLVEGGVASSLYRRVEKGRNGKDVPLSCKRWPHSSRSLPVVVVEVLLELLPSRHTVAEWSSSLGGGGRGEVFRGHASSSMVMRLPESMKHMLGEETWKNSYKEVLMSMTTSCRIPSANYDMAGTLVWYASCGGGTRKDSIMLPTKGGCDTANVAAEENGSRGSRNDNYFCFCRDLRALQAQMKSWIEFLNACMRDWAYLGPGFLLA